MKIVKLLVICVTFCCIFGENIPNENESQVKELLTEGIIDSGKQVPTDCPKCSCGIPNSNQLSKQLSVNQYPWLAIMLFDNKFRCGGSLINDRYVITLAHCVYEFYEDRGIKNFTVRLLEHDRSTDNETKLIDRNVKSIFIHPQFDGETIRGDIALVKFTQPVKFVGILNPVCLPTPGISYFDYNGVAVGWGARKGFDYEKVLLNVPSQINVTIFEIANTNDNVCTKFRAELYCPGMDGFICKSDYGGPLQFRNNTAMPFEIVGVAYGGNGCDFRTDAFIISAFIKVTTYLDWIHDNTIDACKCL